LGGFVRLHLSRAAVRNARLLASVTSTAVDMPTSGAAHAQVLKGVDRPFVLGGGGSNANAANSFVVGSNGLTTPAATGSFVFSDHSVVQFASGQPARTPRPASSTAAAWRWPRSRRLHKQLRQRDRDIATLREQLDVLATAVKLLQLRMPQ